GAVPRAGAAAGLNIAGDAVVHAAAGAADAGGVIDQMVVADVQPRRSDGGRVDGADAARAAVGGEDELSAVDGQVPDARVIDGEVPRAGLIETAGAIDVGEGDGVGVGVDRSAAGVDGDVTPAAVDRPGGAQGSAAVEGDVVVRPAVAEIEVAGDLQDATVNAAAPGVK